MLAGTIHKEPAMPAMILGEPATEFLEVEVLRRAYPPTPYSCDGNTVTARVTLAVGGFRGAFTSLLHLDDLKQFRDELKELPRVPEGTAEFSPLEEPLQFEIGCDGKGRCIAKCEAADRFINPNRLLFELEFEQTAIPGIVRQVDAIFEAFPVLRPTVG
jgi:hypothetical protein